MNERGTIHSEAMVQFKRLLPGPAERVWEAISEGGLPWLGGGCIEPRAGGAVNIRDGHIRGVVTQWEPPRLLAHTWNVFGPGDKVSPLPESYVRFELNPQGTDVLLTLSHRPVPREYEGRTLIGWHTLLELLQAQLQGVTAEPRDVIMERNRVLYGVEKFKPQS